jgi:hypothetical protein
MHPGARNHIKARYGKRELSLSVHIVNGGGPNLMGRDWLSQFEVNLCDLKLIQQTHNPEPLNAILDKHPDVFRDEIGCLRDRTVNLTVHENAIPKFFKPRPVPFLLKDMVQKELDNLQKQGIISPVQTSSWAAPIVPVVKKNGKMRICGDYKITVNQASPTETYLLPTAEELFAKLAGRKFFTKLDMSSAYLQLPLDDESKKYTTINTHKGLFQYNCLPFGVTSLPAIFQCTMDTLLQGIEGVSVYVNDILVTGPTEKEHLKTLERVLEKLVDTAGLRLNLQKCFFL